MEVAAATGVKNPGNLCLIRVAITFWIFRFAQNDSFLKTIAQTVTQL
jgi:hypothetical protein